MKTLRFLVFGVAFVAGAAAGISVDRWWQTPRVTTIVRDGSRTILLDKPALKTRDFTQYVADKTEVTRLMGELAAQAYRVTTLTETIASLRSQGGGQAVPGIEPVSAEPTLHFEDWRLTFDAKGDRATYSLHQRFEALAAIGRDDRGKPVATVRLFEIGPGDVRTALTDSLTTAVLARPDDAPRWRSPFAIQMGGTYSVSSGHKPQAAGVLALQWLRRGTNTTAEGSSVALLSPALLLGTDLVEPAILPISVNLGRIERQPFRDLWLSPVVSQKRIGISLTATF